MFAALRTLLVFALGVGVVFSVFGLMGKQEPICAQSSCSLVEIGYACEGEGVDDPWLCNVVTPTITPTPTFSPTPIPAEPWIRFRTTTFASPNFDRTDQNTFVPNVDPEPFREGDFQNVDPLFLDTASTSRNLVGGDTTPITFEVDDTEIAPRPRFETGVARVNLGPNSDIQVNDKDWMVSFAEDGANELSPDRYLAYARTRKQHSTISSLGEIQPNTINIIGPNTSDDFVGEQLQTASGDSTALNQSPYVLIVNGDLRLTEDINPDLANHIAIVVNGTLTIAEAVTEANVIWYVNELVLEGTPQGEPDGLRIIGNLMVKEGLEQQNIERRRDDANRNRPAVFVAQNITTYIRLMPFFSQADYQWKSVE